MGKEPPRPRSSSATGGYVSTNEGDGVKSRGWRRAPWGTWAFCGVLVAAGFGGNTLAEAPGDETPTEAEVAYATAGVLAHAQFSHRPLDDQLSSRFLEGYLNALDASHLVFRQSDVEEFGWFRPRLAEMTASDGETWPAHLIYARFLRRLAEQVEFETNLLQTAKFDFQRHDSWQPDRHDLLRPRDRNAARALWREEVRADYLQEKLAGLSPAQIAVRLTRHYERRLQLRGRFAADEVLEIYLDALARAFDPHSDYFGHEEAQEFNIEMKLSLVGIGGSLESADGSWVVGELAPGGPAARSGQIHPGDRILAIAQGDAEPEEVTDMSWWQVVNLLRGPEGSTVRLTLVPAGLGRVVKHTVSLVREDIRLTDEYAQASIVDLPGPHQTTLRIGVINLPLFYEKSGTNGGGATADTARLIRKLGQEGIEGLILDLRRNRGGSLPEAVGVTGLFIPAGPVVQTHDAMGHVEVGRSPAASALYSGPLVILTSRFSASSSEIVAGALQDYGRALIVGDSSTFGKGTVQKLVPLKKLLDYSGCGAVKVTVAKFYRPSGASTQLKGVVPDLVLPSESDLPSVGEAQLPNALPWDVLPPATYTNFDLVRPWLSELRDKSRARVDTDPRFRVVREELAAAVIDQTNALSLDESVRRRNQARANELAAESIKASQPDPASATRIYDITLANVGSAGLPPPRQPAQVTVTAAQPAEPGWEDDIELLEAEHILADYIQLLPALPGKNLFARSGQNNSPSWAAPTSSFWNRQAF